MFNETKLPKEKAALDQKAASLNTQNNFSFTEEEVQRILSAIKAPKEGVQW